MKYICAASIPLALLASLTVLAGPMQSGAAFAAPEDFLGGLRKSIEGYLGKPYTWGATGSKTFDCSGFVWRVMFENGVLFKRTTARKLSMSLRKPEAGRSWEFGNIIFFNNCKHCGIVKDSTSFYHAASTMGTTESSLGPYWRSRLDGVRCFPRENIQ